MVFRVEVAPQTLEDLDAIAAYIKQRGSFESAESWFNEVIDAIRTLENMPKRCPAAQESADLGTEVRLLFHGKRNRGYKVYFAIYEATQTVRVFHVRHWARRQPHIRELRDWLPGAPETPPPSSPSDR